jgi:hypothetical protein
VEADIPNWEPLAGALKRVTAAGVSEDEAKRDLCLAMGRQIGVRVRIAGRVFSGASVLAPSSLNPCDFDWVHSRPLTQWAIRPKLGQHSSNWREGWKLVTPDLIELSPREALEILDILDGGGTSADTGANPPAYDPSSSATTSSHATRGAENYWPLPDNPPQQKAAADAYNVLLRMHPDRRIPRHVSVQQLADRASSISKSVGGPSVISREAILRAMNRKS